MRKGSLARFLGFAAIAAFQIHAGWAQQYAPRIDEYLEKDGRFTTFLHLARMSGVSTSWLSSNPIGGSTVIAPTDEAFAQLPRSVMKDLLNNRQELVKVLTYHILPREKDSAAVRLGPTTVEGAALSLTGGVPPRTANFLKRDVIADNGRIDIIDQVLFPPDVFTELQRSGDFPIAVGLGIHGRMSAGAVVTNVPLRSATGSRSKGKKGHWGRIPGQYGKHWIPGG